MLNPLLIFQNLCLIFKFQPSINLAQILCQKHFFPFTGQLNCKAGMDICDRPECAKQRGPWSVRAIPGIAELQHHFPGAAGLWPPELQQPDGFAIAPHNENAFSQYYFGKGAFIHSLFCADHGIGPPDRLSWPCFIPFAYPELCSNSQFFPPLFKKQRFRHASF